MELSQNEGYNGEVCMITDLNKILVEWAYRTNDGQPNSKNSAHIIILERGLNDFGWYREAIAELLNNWDFSKDLVNDYLKTMCQDMAYEVLDDIHILPERLLYLYRRLRT